MSKIQIGDLTERITLQYFTVAKDAMGGRPKTWNDVVTVWASVEPLSLTNLGSSGAREYFYAQQIRAEVVYKVNIRYYPGIQNSWRLKWGDRIMRIEAVLENGDFLTIICRETKASESPARTV